MTILLQLRFYHNFGHVDHPPLARQPHADPHPRKQLENRHGWRLTIQTDGYVRGQSSGDHDVSVGVCGVVTTLLLCERRLATQSDVRG